MQLQRVFDAITNWVIAAIGQHPRTTVALLLALFAWEIIIVATDVRRMRRRRVIQVRELGL